jgi:hypothetical protein
MTPQEELAAWESRANNQRGRIMLRDVLTRRDGGKPAVIAPPPDISVTVTDATEPHDEPTWEVRHPGTRRRVDGRTKTILAAAAAAALMVNAGAAWAYWRVMASHTGARAGSAVQLTLRGRSDLNLPLAPGRTGNLTVTVINDNDFPIRITSVTPAVGNIVADDEHRDAGCLDTGVSMTKAAFSVSWEVARNTIGAFVIPDGLTMSRTANRACVGATFSVPVHTIGVSNGR